MKRLIALLLAVIMALSFSACAVGERQVREPEMYIEPARLNEDEKKMAQLLGGLEDQTIFDFSADDSVRSLTITGWKLENGEWKAQFVDGQRLDESSGRIALSFEDITEGCRIAVQTQSGFNAGSGSSEPDEKLEGMGRTTAYLAQRREIEYGEEIALMIQTFTDKSEVISYDPEYFEHPEEYEKLGYDGVFAITACFSQDSENQERADITEAAETAASPEPLWTEEEFNEVFLRENRAGEVIASVPAPDGAYDLAGIVMFTEGESDDLKLAFMDKDGHCQFCGLEAPACEPLELEYLGEGKVSFNFLDENGEAQNCVVSFSREGGDVFFKTETGSLEK